MLPILPMQPRNRGLYPYLIRHAGAFSPSLHTAVLFTPAAQGDREKWTLRTLVKRCRLGAWQCIMGAAADSHSYDTIAFTADDELELNLRHADSNHTWRSVARYRDTAAWYDIEIHFWRDRPSGSQVQMWMNGLPVEVQSVPTYPAGYATQLLSFSPHAVGRHPAISEYDFDGLLAQPCLYGGEPALAAPRHGEFLDGIWVPKKPTDVCAFSGVSDFLWQFQDGADMANNAAPSNTTVFTGTPPLHSEDTPTNNHARLHPLKLNSNVTLSQNNTVAAFANNRFIGLDTVVPATGKWIYEARVPDAQGDGTAVVGFGAADKDFTGSYSIMNTPSASNPAIGYGDMGIIYQGESYAGGYPPLAAGDIVTVTVDRAAAEFTLYKNGEFVETIAGEMTTKYPWVFGAEANAYGREIILHVTESDIVHPVAGFNVPSSANMPEAKPVGVHGAKTLGWAGDGNPKDIAGALFKPDLVWTKGLNLATNHFLFDAVRGAGWGLSSDTSSGHSHNDYVDAFNDDGFHISGQPAVNYAGYDFHGICLKKGPEFGFDIVDFAVGPAGTQIVDHNLGGEPELILLKEYSQNGGNWLGYWKGLTSLEQAFFLNTSDAVCSVADMWGAGHCATQFQFRAGYCTTQGQRAVAYLFRSIPGFLKVGAYLGNANSDGPYIDLGFRPEIMMTRPYGAGHSALMTALRPGYNPTSHRTYANDTAVEVTNTNGMYDLLSGGFKARTSAPDVNGSGSLYGYIAWAAQPAKHSNAR